MLILAIELCSPLTLKSIYHYNLRNNWGGSCTFNTRMASIIAVVQYRWTGYTVEKYRLQELFLWVFMILPGRITLLRWFISSLHSQWRINNIRDIATRVIIIGMPVICASSRLYHKSPTARTPTCCKFSLILCHA